MLVHNDLSVSDVKSNSYEGCVETLWLKLHTKSHCLKVGLIYRSPLSTEISDIALLSELISESNKYKGDLILVGDFNLPCLFESNLPNSLPEKYQKFLNVFSEVGLHQKVDSPTRQDNILDLILSTDIGLVTNLRIMEPFSTSDHNKICFNLNMTNNLTSNVKYFDYEKGNYDGMNDFLCSVDWDTLLVDSDVEEMWETFTHFMQYAIEIYIPRREHGNPMRTHWSNSTKRAYQYKRKLWKKYSKNRSDLAKKLYKTAANYAKEKSKIDLAKVEQKILSSKNIRQFYKFVNSKLTTKNVIPPIYDPLNNNSLLLCNSAKASAFQHQFCSVFTEDNGEIPNFDCQTVQELESVEISEAVVLRILKKLPNKSSSGPDSIPPIILRKTADSICAILTAIFVKSFRTSEIPKQWLQAKVIPIYKRKGDNSKPENYRPISLTVAVSKVFETLVKNNILNYLIFNKLININQHGFLPRKSTLTNVLKTMHTWMNSRLLKKNIHSCYVDFSKAFDSVSHSKLIYKLKCYGISGGLLSWLRSFLINRTQCVVCHNVVSEWKPVLSGVPQGSVLGPLLFTVFVNDLPCVVKNSQIALFADDAKIFTTIDSVKSVAKFQEDLSRVDEWSKAWQLPIAASKCSVFICGPEDHSPQYSLGTIALENVTTIRDLGFYLTHDLKFSSHCNYISKKGLSASACIFRSFKSRDRSFLLNLFKTYVRPIVETHTPIWSPFLLKDIRQIERVQRRFTKRLPGLHNTPYPERLFFLGLKSLEHRRLIFDIELTYKIMHNLLDIDFDLMFNYMPASAGRGHDLRLALPKPSSNVTQNFFSNRVPRIWNSLPKSVVQANNLVTLRNRLHTLDLKHFLRGAEG